MAFQRKREVVPAHRSLPPSNSSSPCSSRASSRARSCESGEGAGGRCRQRSREQAAAAKLKARQASLRACVTGAEYRVINCLRAEESRGVFQVVDRADGRLHCLTAAFLHGVPSSPTLTQQHSPTSSIPSSAFAISLLREADMLQRFRHKNILRFHHAHGDSHCVYLATEYCALGSAADYAARYTHGLSELNALYIAHGVLRALCFLHDRGVAHRNVRPSTILLTARGSVRLSQLCYAASRSRAQHHQSTTDISHCSRGHKEEEEEEGGGDSGKWINDPPCAEYAAPETIFRKDGDPAPGDLWSVGMTLYALLTRNLRFGNASWLRVTNGGNSMGVDVKPLLADARLDHISTPCRSLLKALLAPKPSDRPTAHRAIVLCLSVIKQHSDD